MLGVSYVFIFIYSFAKSVTCLEMVKVDIDTCGSDHVSTISLIALMDVK
jgi:hypothetical protein